jgi:hypothetical protein
MNLTDHKNYIEKLCTTSNNYFMYDLVYIKNKYNIDSYNDFRKYFKKNHNEKIIFNSEKAENFFIKIMNIDSDFMNTYYKDNQTKVIIDFFIKMTNCYFNKCEHLNSLTPKQIHFSSCKCKIKVKSVVNLSIDVLIFILSEHIQLSKINNNKNIIKLYNNPINHKIIECIKTINIAKNCLGLENDNMSYQLTDTNFNNDKQEHIINTTINEEHLISEIENKKNELLNNDLSDKTILNNLSNYISDNTNKEESSSSSSSSSVIEIEEVSHTTVSNEESSNTIDSNRFGNVIIKENKVKLEKKSPVDLNNESDILISYNENKNENKEYNKNKENEENIKKDVLELLHNLDSNFNYITSDDILIDVDKKIQICTFMVEIKYKIFGMFHHLEKNKTLDIKLKTTISNNYELIYNYVIHSNKIGSTGEMVEFNKNKQYIKYIINDITSI